MLGIDFAKVPAGLTGISGMEFMDYQNPDLYNELRAIFDRTVEATGDGGWSLNVDDEDIGLINATIMKHTGMNVVLQKPNWESVPNAAVDAGFFSPNNLINIKGIDQWIAAKDSNIGKAFKALKVNVLKGWVDTSKGRVGGDYSKIKIDMYIQKHIQTFMEEKFLQRNKVTMAEALSMIVLHECGHVFTGFLYVTTMYMDSMMSMQAVRLIEDNKMYGKQRVEIIKETLSILECDVKVEEKDVGNMSAADLTVYFNKATTNRDYRRTLSLGTADRGSEVFADLFAIRYGAPKIMVAALGSLPNGGEFYNGMILTCVGCAIMSVIAAAPVLVAYSVFLAGFWVVMKYQTLLNPNDVYDAPYRRLKNILRDQVIRLNEDKRLDSREKVRMLKEAKEMEKMIDEQKPYLEGTAVQRFLGWMFSGSDFSAQQFEHYNEELLAHTLSLYKEAF
uniref:Virion structural protein n=1 Tax=Pantoea phage Survivor TaxID=3232176 RepID=A0AAU8KXD9_9CAUD